MVTFVMVLSIVLRIKRTLDGAEIDKSSGTLRTARRWQPSIGGVLSGARPRWLPAAFGLNVITPMSETLTALS